MALRISAVAAQRRQAALCEALLVAPQRPGGVAERAGDVILVGPALLDEHDHDVCLGHAIAEPVLRTRDAGDEHQPVRILSAYQAPLVDEDGALGRVGWTEELPGRRGRGHGGDDRPAAEKADRFGSAPLAAQGRGFRAKNPGNREALCQEIWSRFRRRVCFLFAHYGTVESRGAA
jgi:hypothetical protein